LGLVSQLFTLAQPIPHQALGDVHPIDLLKNGFGLVSQLITSAQPIPQQALGDVHPIDLLKYGLVWFSQLFTPAQPVPHQALGDVHPIDLLKYRFLLVWLVSCTSRRSPKIKVWFGESNCFLQISPSLTTVICSQKYPKIKIWFSQSAVILMACVLLQLFLMYIVQTYYNS
jgi:hypothetical protein